MEDEHPLPAILICTKGVQGFGPSPLRFILLLCSKPSDRWLQESSLEILCSFQNDGYTTKQLVSVCFLLPPIWTMQNTPIASHCSGWLVNIPMKWVHGFVHNLPKEPVNISPSKLTHQQCSSSFKHLPFWIPCSRSKPVETFVTFDKSWPIFDTLQKSKFAGEHR